MHISLSLCLAVLALERWGWGWILFAGRNNYKIFEKEIGIFLLVRGCFQNLECFRNFHCTDFNIFQFIRIPETFGK